jgi:tetratricopeptide (TPR) repeat protein
VPAGSEDEDWLVLGLDAMRALDYERALTCFDEAVLIHPASHAIWYSRGLAFYNLGDDAAALESFTRASEYQPQSHLAWYGCGVTLAEMGRAKRP